VIEIPEAVSLARQLTGRFGGKEISAVVAGQSPHKFAWYYGDRNQYASLSAGKVFDTAQPVGGMVEGSAGGVRFLFSEGTNLRFVAAGAPVPKKHQLLVTFTDGTALVVSVQMYGGMGVFRAGHCDNPYYLKAREMPSPLSGDFDAAYFEALVCRSAPGSLSVKALLATEQRIPGLGNGVLQDILFRAKINPRAKVDALGAMQRKKLFQAVKKTLREMADSGGRDTELDLDGKPGGYRTVMSRNNVGKPCPECGAAIEKAAYMGGSVYFCPSCQAV
jgi:formamidopyrimidine-DNA glycosylase